MVTNVTENDESNVSLRRSNVSDGPIFRRHIFHIRHRGTVICGERPGGPHRSDGDKKYISTAKIAFMLFCFQVYIFPRMTKCTFHKFGTSGEIEKHDAMCILPLNIGVTITIIDAYLFTRSEQFQ